MLKRIVGRLFHIAISLLVTGALVFSMIGSVHSFATDYTPDPLAAPNTIGHLARVQSKIAKTMPSVATHYDSQENVFLYRVSFGCVFCARIHYCDLDMLDTP